MSTADLITLSHWSKGRSVLETLSKYYNDEKNSNTVGKRNTEGQRLGSLVVHSHDEMVIKLFTCHNCLLLKCSISCIHNQQLWVVYLSKQLMPIRLYMYMSKMTVPEVYATAMLTSHCSQY